MPPPIDPDPSGGSPAADTASSGVLAGLRVAVTRPTDQSAHLAELLANLGATVIREPLIAIESPDDTSVIDEAIGRLDWFDWLVFSSANGASRFLDRMKELERPVPELEKPRIAAVGRATEAAVRKRGGRVDLVPERFVAESLVEAFRAKVRIAGTRVLIARAADARDTIPAGLAREGALVETVDLYRTVARPESAHALAELIAGHALDVVVLASGSAVDAFAQSISPEAARAVRTACIGPVTAAAARRYGLNVWVEADEHTDEGLARAIARAVNPIEQ